MSLKVRILRRDGMTLSAIAAADGTVSTQTVMRAIDDSEIPNGISPQTTIISKNGNARPTKYAKAQKPQSDYMFIHLLNSSVHRVIHSIFQAMNGFIRLMDSTHGNRNQDTVTDTSKMKVSKGITQTRHLQFFIATPGNLRHCSRCREHPETAARIMLLTINQVSGEQDIVNWSARGVIHRLFHQMNGHCVHPYHLMAMYIWICGCCYL
jgi:hypothetical protein